MWRAPHKAPARTHLLQFFWLLNIIDEVVSVFKKKHETIHDRKLRRIGIDNSLQPCDPKKVIFNFSSKTLSTRIKFLLAFGIDFKLPIWKLNYYDYFLCFESLIQSIWNEQWTQKVFQRANCPHVGSSVLPEGVYIELGAPNVKRDEGLRKSIGSMQRP